MGICTLCPRNCRVDRTGEVKGICGAGAGYDVAAVTLHHGEEPDISGANGICNVFFAGCNLRCLYCQNYQISKTNGIKDGALSSLSRLTGRIISFLEQGVENVGFVSPSHMVPQVRAVINDLHRLGYTPIIVYNTNAYERVETLRSLEGLVDVYLPDFKYMDAGLASCWSGAADYPRVAAQAIKEMYRQKGNRLFYTEKGKLRSGMIVRHLVLPDAVPNSIAVFRFLAEEVSTRLAVSVMAQYNPTPEVASLPSLGRMITEAEYRRVVAAVEELGFETGWLQEFASATCYSPDFTKPLPFDR